MIYIKKLEAYRLQDGEQPKWVKDAIKQGIIVFERKEIVEDESFKVHKKAIVGIEYFHKVYPVDSYIVKDDSRIRVVDAYDFETQGFVKAEEN